jgi:hypothetical protein
MPSQVLYCLYSTLLSKEKYGLSYQGSWPFNNEIRNLASRTRIITKMASRRDNNQNGLMY